MSEEVDTSRPEKTKKEIATQVARIAGKLVERANDSGLARDNYPTGKRFNYSEQSPDGPGRIVTAVETDNHGIAKVERYSLSNGERVGGKVVSAVPEIGFDTRNIGRDGHENVVIGSGQEEIVANVPEQLSALRGNLAEREISGDNPKARLAA